MDLATFLAWLSFLRLVRFRLSMTTELQGEPITFTLLPVGRHSSTSKSSWQLRNKPNQRGCRRGPLRPREVAPPPAMDLELRSLVSIDASSLTPSPIDCTHTETSKRYRRS
ncbi:hypothetical protein C8Q74DRAFT_74017 [Fomes fomentarius]|nr:hypothetical protein C8Q74DRAFT_74017 [Fomes fomentarius]